MIYKRLISNIIQRHYINGAYKVHIKHYQEIKTELLWILRFKYNLLQFYHLSIRDLKWIKPSS